MSLSLIKKLTPYFFVVVVSIGLIGQIQFNADRNAREIRDRIQSKCISIQSNWDTITRILLTGPDDPLVIPPEVAPEVPESTVVLIEEILTQANDRANAQKRESQEKLGPRPECP